MKVERIEDLDGVTLALVVRDQVLESGVNFVTHPEDPMQVAFIAHPRGHRIEAHRHLDCERPPLSVTEVLEVRKGRLQVFFYGTGPNVGGYTQSRILAPGDVAVLLTGGHGFLCLEDVELIEVKQGPYRGKDKDKETIGGTVPAV